MKVYKFKCKDCGSKSYEKLDDHTYKCKYCGQIEEVYLNDENEEKVDSSQTNQDETNENKTETKSKFAKTLENKDVSYAFVKFIICLVLGAIGVHKFMEGKIFVGLIYFFTGGLLGIGYIIDCVKTGLDFINIYNENRNKVEIND